MSVFACGFVDVFGETQEAILFLCKTSAALISLVGNQTKVSSFPAEKVGRMLVWQRNNFL